MGLATYMLGPMRYIGSIWTTNPFGFGNFKLSKNAIYNAPYFTNLEIPSPKF